MLSVEHLVSGYGHDPILRGVTFTVPDRKVVAVLGHNGAGKSSLVKTLIGLIPAWEGRVVVDGADIAKLPSSRRVRAGIAVSFQDDAVFPTLSVATNLELGGHVYRGARDRVAGRVQRVLALFPALEKLLGQAAYTLSGGQRRMLSIGMALMSDPKLLILDEPSTGLSPRAAEMVFTAVVAIRDELKKSVLLIEQNVENALALSDRAVVLKTGTVIFDGAPSKLTSDSAALIGMF
jgi:ABC-type branched-subunit amino acid transport system ATPase component